DERDDDSHACQRYPLGAGDHPVAADAGRRARYADAGVRSDALLGWLHDQHHSGYDWRHAWCLRRTGYDHDQVEPGRNRYGAQGQRGLHHPVSDVELGPDGFRWGRFHKSRGRHVFTCRPFLLDWHTRRKSTDGNSAPSPSARLAAAPTICGKQQERLSNMDPDVPSPEPVPPVNNPDPQPGDPKPKAPPSDEDPGRRHVPIELPGKPGMPERARSGLAALAIRV